MNINEFEKKHSDLMDNIDVILMSLDNTITRIARDIENDSELTVHKTDLKDVIKRFKKVTKEMVDLYNSVDSIERKL